MKNTNIIKLIDDELDKESKRIFEILMKLYKEKKIVNKLFSDLIKENYKINSNRFKYMSNR